MKIKYELEYPMNCSPLVLYPRLSTPGGLSEWFADNVNVIGKYYIFFWNGSSQKAEFLLRKDNSFIRFRWEEDLEENYFFEFRIIADEVTGDIALIVTDFADEEEIEEASDLWNSQIATLKHCIGV